MQKKKVSPKRKARSKPKAGDHIRKKWPDIYWPVKWITLEEAKKLWPTEALRHLRNVLIAFAHPDPSEQNFEDVSNASLWLQEHDEDWKKRCNRGFLAS